MPPPPLEDDAAAVVAFGTSGGDRTAAEIVGAARDGA